MDEKMDLARLRSALDVANIPSLIPVLVQLTGDRRWLHEPYRPLRAQGMDDNDDGGLPEKVQREIRDAAYRAVVAWNTDGEAAMPAPRGNDLLELLAVCTGEAVPPEYEGMSAEILEISPPSVTQHPAPRPNDLVVIVVGAGISGLTASKYLSDLGIQHTVLEKNADVGGTWLENDYPGAGVDTPSYLYSLSYFPRDWTHHFGKRDELEGYLGDVADAFALRSRIRFGTTVESATWDESSRQWEVVSHDEQGAESRLRCDVLISAVGQLNIPKVPRLEGMDRFTGDMFHTAQWPEGAEIDGRRVAVVGSGASSMQVVPAIADRVGHLDVYQRSPQWVSPNKNYFREVTDDIHWLMANVPFYRGWYRFRLAWLYNDRIHFSLQKDPDWPHPERSLNRINDSHRRFFTQYIEDQLAGRPDLLEKALPDYPPFGKRMLLDNGWYAALKKNNVDLITEEVAGFTETGVVTASGEERPADVVVLATGFEAHRPIRFAVRGRDGHVLQDDWGADDARAYLGVTVPDYPNLFLMYGPNTNLGHGGSFIFLAESQVTYIMDAITKMIDGGIATIECRREVFEEYNREMEAAHERMVWTHRGMNTWYRNSRGRIVTTMPWRVVDYWAMTRSVNLADFIVEPRTAVGHDAAIAGAH